MSSIYKMRIWERGRVQARSRFWTFLKSTRSIKTTLGRIIYYNKLNDCEFSVNIYGIWFRYRARCGNVIIYGYREIFSASARHAVYNIFKKMVTFLKGLNSRVNILRLCSIEPKYVRSPNVLQFSKHINEIPPPDMRLRHLYYTNSISVGKKKS